MVFSVSKLYPYLSQVINRLASPAILFWMMPFLILLLFVGTIVQKDIGIHASVQIYFASLVYWIGWVPLPGGLTLLSIMFVNLLAKFLFRSEWSWSKSGTIISHFGILLLIIGGAISYALSYEGYLTVQEGKTTSIVKDYHQRMFEITDGETILVSKPFEELSLGELIPIPQTDVSLKITELCYNCHIQRRAEDEQDGWIGPGQFMQLIPTEPKPQDEENITGIEFEVTGANAQENGFRLTFDKFPKPPQIQNDKKTYTVLIDRARRELPFNLTLHEFKQDFHAGTDMASAYQSLMTVTDGASSWPVLIEMNEPLRHRGYTFYQSSFDLSGDKPYTILAVVDNKGRLFPYLATIIIALGLLVHIAIRLTLLRRSKAVF
jgi:hypothetical protein